jgi:hypothetical protein
MSVIDEIRDGKVGRVPVWALGLIIAGAILLFVIIRNRLRKNTGDAAVENPSEDLPLESVDGIPAQSFADQLSNRFPQNVSVLPTPVRPQTNNQWQILAFDFLAGLGNDPGKVQRALQEYLAGRQLTAEQQLLINRALANPVLGLPPEGVTLPPLPGDNDGFSAPPPPRQVYTPRLPGQFTAD